MGSKYQATAMSYVGLDSGYPLAHSRTIIRAPGFRIRWRALSFLTREIPMASTSEAKPARPSQTVTRDFDRSKAPQPHDGSTEDGQRKTAQWVKQRDMAKRREAQGWG